MSDIDCIRGEIENPSCQTYVEWKIANYFSISQKADTSITSPTFHFLNESWYLKIYPNGERKNKSVEWMSFYLGRKDPVTESLSITLSLGIRCEDGGVRSKRSGSYDFFSSATIGWPKFFHRNELLRCKHKIASGETLTVFCMARKSFSVAETASQTAQTDGVSTLSRNFQSVFHNAQKSDVTIKVKSRLFHVHKLILGARSSVFSAMFEHDMKENSSGIVDIEDCEPDAFLHFLLFVYTGKIEKLSSNNVTSLYSLADKYDLRDLKAICMEYMKDNLSLDSVCEMIVIADRHNDLELKKPAADLIGKNIKAIIPTEQWISFMAENPVLAAELLLKVIPDNS